MTLADLKAIFRREMRDAVSPYLWSDVELAEFANDAVMEAVRRGLSIIDSTTIAGPIATSAKHAGGSGYAASDTGTVPGIVPATYLINTVSTGAVATYTLTGAGSGFVPSMRSTVVGGAHPGAGSGFTIDVLSVTAGVGICSLDYSTDPVLTLDPRVISIRSAIVRGQSLPLARRTVDWMDACYPGWRTITSQYPLVYISDWGSGKIRLYPTPTLAGTVDLSVAREPLQAMQFDSDAPEIPARHHRALVFWMRYRAYDKDDTETRDQAMVDKYEAKFASEFGERRSARNEKWAAEQAGAYADTLC